MPSKIVYLLGAGATHAEIVNLYPEKSGDTLFIKKNGLLMKQVSERVIEEGKRTGLLKRGWIKRQLSPAGLSNIELFIRGRFSYSFIIDNVRGRFSFSLMCKGTVLR